MAAGAALASFLPHAFGAPLHPHAHQALVGHFFVWDSDWYDRILREGYRWRGLSGGHQNAAFFPLWPLVLRADYALAGGHGPGGRALVVATAAAIAWGSIVAVSAWARETLGPEKGRVAALLYVCNPAAPMLFFSYPTGLMNALVAAALLAWRCGRFGAAACWCGVATAAGPLPACLAGALAVSRFLHERRAGAGPGWAALRAAGTGALASAGLLLFALYLWRHTGHPLAFRAAQDAWVGSMSAGRHLWRTLRLLLVWPDITGAVKSAGHMVQALRSGHGRLAEEGAELALGFAAVATTLTGCAAAIVRLRPRVAGVFGFAVVVVYVWSIAAAIGPVSAVRLTYLALPAFAGWAELVGRRPALAVCLSVAGWLSGAFRAALLWGGYWAI